MEVVIVDRHLVEVRQVARAVEKMEKAQRLAIEELQLYLKKQAALQRGDIATLNNLRAREGRIRPSSLALATLHYYHEVLGLAASLAKVTRIKR
jgi:hypothetical protein